MGDNYVKISGTISVITEKAILFNGDVWIPRSCIYGPDEVNLDDIDGIDEVEIRVFEWLAKARGLI